MPFEAVDVEGRAGVAFERLGGAKGHDGAGQVVMPGAGVGIVFLVGEGVILAQFQLWFGTEERDSVDLAAFGGNMFFVAPA